MCCTGALHSRPIIEQLVSNPRAEGASEIEILSKKTCDDVRMLEHEVQFVANTIYPNVLDLILQGQADRAHSVVGAMKGLLVLGAVCVPHILLHLAQAPMNKVDEPTAHQWAMSILEACISHELLLFFFL